MIEDLSLAFDHLEPFEDGIAIAAFDGGWFHVNERGRPLYPERFDVVLPFVNQRATARRNGFKYELIKAPDSSVTIRKIG